QVAPSAERGDGGDAGAEAPSGESIPEDGLGKLSLRPGEERDDGADRAPGPPSGRPGLRGTPEQMREIFGSRSSHDAVEDVDEGADNILNSKRWKYASFFNRVRDAIAQHWDPVSVRAARDPDGTRWGTQTRTTSLFLRLNADGSVKRISIERSCGIAALDEEAIRAVRAAQPFPNPPRQLVDPSTGTIDFPFGFILEINGSP
ncbi:MAG: energy transducer TonB, partial [Myxococcales bacterium]|nr:energy transducer TonB [Myxococcales bacterium]